jgi:hypothetical protein
VYFANALKDTVVKINSNTNDGSLGAGADQDQKSFATSHPKQKSKRPSNDLQKVSF